MEICISNIVADYRVYLENISISQFLRPIEVVMKTSFKPSTGRPWKTNKKEAHHALAVDDRPDYNPRKMMEKKSDKVTYPLLACNSEEFQAILDTMLADGAIKLHRPYKTSSREDMKDPRYYCYHKYMGHPSIVCQTLRKIIHAKIREGTLELPCKTQAIDTDPLPKRRRKEMETIITCSRDDDDHHPWINNGKPSEAIWEPFENIKKAYWCK